MQHIYKRMINEVIRNSESINVNTCVT